MAWRQTKVEDQRMYLVKSFISKSATMKELCEECDVSRKTGYKWHQRYLEGGQPALTDSSRAPKAPFRIYEEELILRVLEIKMRYPKYGPKKIHAIFKRRYPGEPCPSPTRLYEIFKEHHLVCSRKLCRRVPRTQPLGEVNQSNDVWCADFKGYFFTGDNLKVEPLTVTDGHTRYLLYNRHIERKRFEDVWKVYVTLFNEFGLPSKIRTDNGPPFATTGVGRLSQLALHLIKAGVTPEWIAPGCPEENGRHERFHRSLKSETASPPAATFGEQTRRLEVFTEEYNFDRPHEALNQQTPGSVYSPSVRVWDGVLRSPEYDTGDVLVRKVGPNGCVYWKQLSCYLGQLLSGEYVSLKEVDNGYFRVHYGPLFLGTLIEGQGFKRPELAPRRRR